MFCSRIQKSSVRFLEKPNLTKKKKTLFSFHQNDFFNFLWKYNTVLNL